MGNKSGKSKGSNNPAILTEERIQHLLNNTNFTREEILKYHAGFIEDCKSGILDKGQFAKEYKLANPKGKVEHFCNQMFKVFDVDNSGTIDFTEFCMLLSVNEKGSPTEKLQMAFKIYDIDKNGRIEQKEMEKMIRAIYELVSEKNVKGENDPERKAKYILEKLDINKDGYLTSEEFVKGCLEDKHLASILTPNYTTEN